MRDAHGGNLDLQPPAAQFVRSVCQVLKLHLAGDPEEVVAALGGAGISAQAEYAGPLLWAEEELTALYGDHVFISSPCPDVSVLLHRLPTHWQMLVNLRLAERGWTGDLPVDLEEIAPPEEG